MGVEILRFTRFCHWLRDREPERLIGASLMLFPLTDEEVRAALYGPVPLDPRAHAQLTPPEGPRHSAAECIRGIRSD